VSFEEVCNGLGHNLKALWSDRVVANGPNAISKDAYLAALNALRPKLQQRYADVYRSRRIDGMVLPTTPTVAPLIDESVPFLIAGQVSDRVMLAKNVFPSSCAGLPGISLPIGLSSSGLPIGMEIDGPRGSDASVLDIAARVFAIVGQLPGPRMN
jgi:mandelamide amidase